MPATARGPCGPHAYFAGTRRVQRLIRGAGDELPCRQVVKEELVRPAAGGEPAVPGHRHAVDRLDGRRQGLPGHSPRLLDRAPGPLVDPCLEQARARAGVRSGRRSCFPWAASRRLRCAPRPGKSGSPRRYRGSPPRPSRPPCASPPASPCSGPPWSSSCCDRRCSWTSGPDRRHDKSRFLHRSPRGWTRHHQAPRIAATDDRRIPRCRRGALISDPWA